jgi:hypothetical protein
LISCVLAFYVSCVFYVYPYEEIQVYETKSVGAINSNEPCIPFQISDDILNLENSKRCLKCGLLYIPELLDNFDICFTCKKKKVCETESRSLSDVINEITNSHADQNLTSTSNGIKDDNERRF